MSRLESGNAQTLTTTDSSTPLSSRARATEREDTLPADGMADLKRDIAKFRSDSSGTLYALRAGQFVKIGFTRGDVRERIASLQTGCPLPIELIGTGWGGRYIESRLHEILKSYRSCGEWFHDVPIVLDLAHQFCPEMAVSS